MRHIGYANIAQINEHASAIVRELSEYECSVVHLGKSEEDEKNEWNYFIDELKEGDTAVIYSFCNVFQSYSAMMCFLKMCSAKKIRIISIHDDIDTADETASGTLAAITKVMNVNKEDAHDDLQAELITGSKRDKKLNMQKMIINMYNAGFSVKEIMAKVGSHSRSNIYRILHAHDVPMEYPNMARKKKADPEGEADSKTTNQVI